MRGEIVNKEALNITNGDCFNEYFLSKFGGVAVPFCEDMMDGDASLDIYSESFIELRSKALNVSVNEYRAKMYVYDALKVKNYKQICLWFGKDTFCQMNLLTLLAYLEQIKYSGKLTLNYIDDETFDVIEADIELSLGEYREIYSDIFISKQMPDNLYILCKKAIDLYFDYHSDHGFLKNLICENADKSKIELIAILLNQSKDYGLSDLQAEKLIDAILNKK